MRFWSTHLRAKREEEVLICCLLFPIAQGCPRKSGPTCMFVLRVFCKWPMSRSKKYLLGTWSEVLWVAPMRNWPEPARTGHHSSGFRGKRGSGDLSGIQANLTHLTQWGFLYEEKRRGPRTHIHLGVWREDRRGWEETNEKTPKRINNSNYNSCSYNNHSSSKDTNNSKYSIKVNAGRHSSIN